MQQYKFACYYSIKVIRYWYSNLMSSTMDLNENKFLRAGLLFLSTIIIIKLISIMTTTSSSGKKQLPPSVKSFPIVGGLIGFLKGPVKMIDQEYEKLGSVFTVSLLNMKVTCLVGPEVSSHFYKAPESDLSQKEINQFSVPTFGPGVMYDVEYSVRHEQMRFYADAFKVSNLRSYAHQMVAEAEDYFSKWGETGTIDLKQELEQLITLSQSRCILGHEVRENLFEEVSSLFKILEKSLLPISIVLPHIPIPAHRRRNRARARLGEIFSNIIRARRSRPSSKPKEIDLIQCLIDSKYENGTPTSEAEITGLLIAALFGGLNACTITSTWTGAYLLDRKRFLIKSVEEQKHLMKEHGNAINYDTLSAMEVLNRCVKEVLRLHPTLALLLRRAKSDFRVRTKEGVEYDVPKGHIVASSPYVSNRLGYVFKDPNVYDPDRFELNVVHDVGEDLSFVSFGADRHRCLGESFSYLQIQAIWSHLLRNFEMELLSPFPEIDWNSMVVGVKGKVMVKYKRRKLSVDN